MLTALAAFVTVSTAFAQAMRVVDFPGPGEKESRFTIRMPLDKQDPPKTSPKQKWLFEWVSAAYGAQTLEESLKLRFRVFNQFRKETGDVSIPVSRMLLRLWDYNYRKLFQQHNDRYNGGIVDVYLCFGGEAGGEQLFDEEIENGFAKKVNTIYIYQIQTFTQPVEMAREVAHEYGHSQIPPIGGFESPEEWGNGYLGEKLFMKWLRDDMRAKRLGPDDALGATLPEMESWVKTNVDPLWMKIARNGPDQALLAGKGPAAMNEYIGLSLWASSLLPNKAFARSLRLTGSVQAADYMGAVVVAATEQPTMTLSVPAEFIKKPIWIPLPKTSKQTGAIAKARKGDWVQVVPQSGTITLANPEPR